MYDSSLQPLVALLGNTVAGNPTQYMFEKAFEHHALDWRFVTFQVDSEQLETAVNGLRALGIQGGIFSPPMDVHAARLLDSLDVQAEKTTAADCWQRSDDGRRLNGHYLGGQTIINLLATYHPIHASHCVVLGAGTLAKAVAVELASLGSTEIQFVVEDNEIAHCDHLVEALRGTFPVVQWSRLLRYGEYQQDEQGSETVAATQSKAAQINSRLDHQPGSTQATEINACTEVQTPPDAFLIPGNTTFLVNTLIDDGENPIDVSEPGIMIDLNLVNKSMVVADTALYPVATELIREAAERSCSIITGLDILIEQAARQFELWIGFQPDRGIMRDAVEEYLEL